MSRFWRAARPVDKLSMSTDSHDRCGSALLESAGGPIHAATLPSAASETPFAFGVREVPEAFVLSNVSARHRMRRAWESHAIGAASASILLHAGVLLAAWQVLAPSIVPWKLHLERGRNSVSLQASIAASPSSVQETEVRVMTKPPLSPPRKSVASQAPTTLNAKAESPTSQPDKPQVEFAETALAQAENPKIPRKEPEAVPSPSTSDHSEVRPPISRRKSPTLLPLDLVVVETSSVASLGAAASSGAEVPVPPHDVHRVLPKYPPESYVAGEEGTVVLWVQVDDQGIVLGTGVKTSSGYPRLDAAAVTAMQQWRFAPATPGDTARAAIFKSSLTFTIPKSK
ncbi:MAG: hypothetical protein C0483_13290 [Pirellula sp.]|nr:hypothetical protein [Pirellula sp.]